jgi:hypothetical protein
MPLRSAEVFYFGCRHLFFNELRWRRTLQRYIYIELLKKSPSIISSVTPFSEIERWELQSSETTGSFISCIY